MPISPGQQRSMDKGQTLDVFHSVLRKSSGDVSCVWNFLASTDPSLGEEHKFDCFLASKSLWF